MSDSFRRGLDHDFSRRTARAGCAVRVSVRFSTAEFATLFTRVRRSAGNVSDYVRRVTLGMRVPARLDVAAVENLMATLAALRVALATGEQPLREAAARSALVQGERALSALLAAQDLAE